MKSINMLGRQFLGGAVAGLGLGLAIAYWLGARLDISIGIELFILGIILMPIGGMIGRMARDKATEKNQTPEKDSENA